MRHKSLQFATIYWCLLTTLLFTLLHEAAWARTAKRDVIDQQLARIRAIQNESGMRLSNNEEFHDWLMVNSR